MMEAGKTVVRIRHVVGSEVHARIVVDGFIVRVNAGSRSKQYRFLNDVESEPIPIRDNA